jgi:hypothetical protein
LRKLVHIAHPPLLSPTIGMSQDAKAPHRSAGLSPTGIAADQAAANFFSLNAPRTSRMPNTVA